MRSWKGRANVESPIQRGFRKPFVRVPLEGSCFAEVGMQRLSGPVGIARSSVSIGPNMNHCARLTVMGAKHWRCPTDSADSSLVAGPSDPDSPPISRKR